MPYRYRLESVLSYRKNLEELAQSELSRELSILVERQRLLEESRMSRSRIISELENLKDHPVPAPLFSVYIEEIRGKVDEIEFFRTKVEEQQQRVAEARRRLAERMKQRKILEKAKERDYKRFLLEERRREQAENDEMVVLRFRRNNVFRGETSIDK